MTALISFLGSAVFRWLLEKLFSLAERKQDHSQEVARIRIQAEVDAAQHLRNLEMLKLQSDLKLDLLQEEVRGASEASAGEAFITSIQSVKPTGVAFVDGWNGIIRPLVSTVCIGLWVMIMITNNFIPNEFDLAIIWAVIGWHFGTRSLLPGKK